MNYGNVISRTQLIDECFEYTRESYDRIIDTHIKNIRAKIGTSGQNWIETVRGYGYRFKGVKKLDQCNKIVVFMDLGLHLLKSKKQCVLLAI